MNLNTGKRITCGRVTKVPLLMVVKEKVEWMADKQGINMMMYMGRNCMELQTKHQSMDKDYESEGDH